MAGRPDQVTNGDQEERDLGSTPSRFNPLSYLTSSTPNRTNEGKTPIKHRIMGAVVGSAVEIVGSALTRSVKSGKTKRIKDTSVKTEDEIQRLNEENLALTAELSMWKGRCKALTRACEQMDNLSATYPPHVREPAGASQSSRNLFRLFSDPLSPRGDALAAMRSPLLATPANMMLSPHQTALTPPEGDIPEFGSQDGVPQTGSEAAAAANTEDEGEKLIRRPATRPPVAASGGNRRHDSVGSSKQRDPTSFRYRDEGNFIRTSSGRFQSVDDRGRMSPSGESEEKFFEHVIHFGVGNNSAPLFWEDQQESVSAGEAGTEDEVVVSCIPEQLWSFPSSPPVLELEQFVFPQQVLVQLETDDTWRGMIPQNGAKSAAQDSDVAAAALEHVVQAVEDQICARKPPGTGQREEGATAGQEAGVSKVVFVLSTKEKGGEPLYGVCLYWDEPCSLLLPLDGRERTQLLKSRHCLCLLTRFPMLSLHEEVLSLVIRHRARLVASRMCAVLQESPSEAPRDGDSSFGVKDWWGVGHELGDAAEQLLADFFQSTVPANARDGPLQLTLAGLPLTLRLAPEEAYCKPEAAALRFGLSALMGHLSMPTIIATVHAMLLERRLVVQCSDLLLLSAIAMALPWLVRPFKWQTNFIPFLPPSLSDFLQAPVPFIAGVLAAPPSGYEDDVVVLHVEADAVIGGDRVPRKAELQELVAKLSPPHGHLSQPGTPPWTRRCRPCAEEIKREVMEGTLSILSSTIAGLISLLEIRGHCIAGRDLVSGEVLTKETKMSYLKTVSHEERAFMGELLDTQLFASYFMQRVSEWFTTDKLDGSARTDGLSLAALTDQLAQSNARLARREEEMRSKLEAKDEEIARLRRDVALLLARGGNADVTRQEESESATTVAGTANHGHVPASPDTQAGISEVHWAGGERTASPQVRRFDILEGADETSATGDTENGVDETSDIRDGEKTS